MSEKNGQPIPLEISFIVAPEEDGMRLSSFLRRRGVSTGLMRRLKWQPDGICCAGERAHTDRRLRAGERVALTLPDETACQTTPDGRFEGSGAECGGQDEKKAVASDAEAGQTIADILYESPHALVLDKPAGLLMHPVGTHEGDTLADAFSALLSRRGRALPFRPVGRLDRDTSGLVLCAMNAYAAPLLAKGARKSYLAIVAGGLPPGPGEVDAPLLSSPGEGPPGVAGVWQQVREEGGKPSRTRYEVLAANRRASLLAVMPLTGRTHQIRAHMAYIGHPLLGDALYGGDRALIGRHALHCAVLCFAEPDGLAAADADCGDGASRTVRAPLPADMRAALEKAGLPFPEALDMAGQNLTKG